ncbi:MAG: hypoxanthine phosphoribosyltransferase [Acidobacteriaceae bacterium]|jgi:hypoxanthine phosphoribosyltransferase|nr:hypoxanthine phosphoribosyltransferase [Acidobacteriaceae bacterium]
MSGRKPASSKPGRQAIKASADGRGTTFSESRIAGRVAEMGKEISRAYEGRRLDIVVTMDRGFVFAADLIRELDGPVVCHFVREDLHDVEDGGHARREVLFSAAPDVKGRDVLLVDAVLESGVTQDFLLRRLGESSPRSIRLAVLLDKPEKRRVDLESDYFGFKTASKEVWVGYGLAAPNGTGRNLRQLSNGAKASGQNERRKK